MNAKPEFPSRPLFPDGELPPLRRKILAWFARHGRELPRLERRPDIRDKPCKYLRLLLACAAAERRTNDAQILSPEKVHIKRCLWSRH